MLNSSDSKHIRETNWYRQGGAINLFYCFSPFQSIRETIGYDGCIMYQEDAVNTAFFERDREDKLALKFIRASGEDKYLVDRWISVWRIRILKLNKFLDKSFSKPLETWSDAELVNFFHRYDHLALSHWKKGVLCEWTDPNGWNIVKTEALKYCPNLSDEDINLLTSPEKLTVVQKELVDRLVLMKKQKQGLSIERELKKHVSKYFWIRNNWAFVYDLKEKDFQKVINKEMLKLEKVERQVKEINEYIREIKKKKKILIKKKSVPRKVQNVFYFFTQLTDWRDERKKFAACLPNHYLYKILKVLAKRNNISEELVGLLIWFEISGWKLSVKTIDNLKRRGQGWIYYCRKNKQCQQVYGSEAKKIFNDLVKALDKGELRGLIANKGVVIGKAKIVEVQADFSKVKKGDIIVANMTRPDYVPIMKLAGGIITNEGGITCHAAIVSRELNIPCIIGTQVATDVLKDGDVIEVDADNGVIRKK